RVRPAALEACTPAVHVRHRAGRNLRKHLHRVSTALPVVLPLVQAIMHRPEFTLVSTTLGRPRSPVSVGEHAHHERNVLVENLAAVHELRTNRRQCLQGMLCAVRAAEIAELDHGNRRIYITDVITNTGEIHATQYDARGS